MERSPVNTLDPSRNWGLAWFGWNEQEDSTFAIGLFQSGTGPSDLQGGDGDGRWIRCVYDKDPNDSTTIYPVTAHLLEDF